MVLTTIVVTDDMDTDTHANTYIPTHTHTHHMCTAIVIGFEEELYTIVEPDQTLQVTLMVCMTVFEGNIGTMLTVVTEYIPGTAQRKQKKSPTGLSIALNTSLIIFFSLLPILTTLPAHNTNT